MQATVPNDLGTSDVDVIPLNRPTAVVTAKGQAVRTVYRLAHQLADLDTEARSDVLHLLATEVRELPPTE